ncbi:hypothetical protein C9993_01360 [Marinobacter sp. Z-F4-2]|nr:hypothetical protein C9993_01360 [Marinobacter sp. Z-F4-2]
MKTNPAPQLWRQPNVKQMQARLNALPGGIANTYEANEWTFQDSRQKSYTISFALVPKALDAYPEWVQAQSITPVPLAKQLFILLAERSTATAYQRTFRGLLLWMAAMASNHITTLTRDGLSEVLKFRLSHQLSTNGIYPSLSLASHAGGLCMPSLVRLKDVCEELGLTWIGRSISDTSINRVLKKLVPELTDGELTYKDWQQGQSYNLLTLDHGQYYVEHCLNVFEKHVPLALALRQTMRDAPEIAESINVAPQTLINVIVRILEGCRAVDIDKKSPNYVMRMQQAVFDHFQSVYQQTRFEHELLQDNALGDIAGTFGLAKSPENLDRLRVILWNWLREGNREETEHLLYQCNTPISWARFEETLESVKRRSFSAPIPVLTPGFFAGLGFEKKHRGRMGIVSYFISGVAKAGLTGVVALTGWRQSEFGFPWSAIQQTSNTDKLDECAFPHRYQVDWFVYKTNGRVRTLREVTFGTLTMIDRLRRLNDSDPEQPCLYASTSSKKDPFNSTSSVRTAVVNLWPHFVHHYPGFKLLDDLKSWQTLADSEASEGLLSMQQHRERGRLLSQRSAQEWDSFTVDENLRAAWRRTRTEWPRLSFFWSKNLRKGRGWVVKYRQGNLNPEWTDLLDAHLSNETRDWLFSLSLEDVTDNKHIGRALSNEVLADALHPSPHAFRHMWAESVYRRFDGDAGWMIRSQFKHISQTMWLAYIRDKDNRFDHQRSKLAVINSLVANFLRHKGEGYTGQMTKLLRRVSQKTRVLTPDEQKELAARLATQEIENLKSNPWGYCLLMRRSRHKAKCAQGGEPMRLNASPELCLGCLHNLMQTSNVEWMIFHVTAHVDALKNPVVPDMFKKSSYELVRNTASHVRKLAPDHEALPEIEAVLSKYQRVA